MNATASLIALWLAMHGYGAPQQLAVLDNAWTESRLDPGAVSRQGDLGLFQHKGPRAGALRAYVGLRLAATDADEIAEHVDAALTLAQLEFMDAEWRGMAPSRRFFATTSRATARHLFCRHFERRRVC